MKKLFAICLLLVSLKLASHSLVLVHIGEELPLYLYDCIAQSRLFNPDCPIYLIANQQAWHKQETILKKMDITPVFIELLPKSEKHQRFLQKTKFQAGFWRYASERFLYIDDFMQSADVTDIFHIENDVMIYVNLEELLPLIKKNYEGMAAVFDSDHRCIPSFMFFPNKNLIAQLAEYFVEHTGQHKNDMEIIAMFRAQVASKFIDRLPIIMNSYIAVHQLKNDLGERPKEPAKYASYIDEFNSIFDGAALGQYLGGTFFADKGPGFINETCVFNPSKLKFEWKLDDCGRKVPFALFAKHYYRINNLHIHSKRLHEFKSK